MTLFLTSSPCLGWAGDLNPANGLIDAMRQALTRPIRCLLITSAPDDQEMTDRMAWEMREIFERADFGFDHYEVLDRRTQRYVARQLREANFIILCGGHVPTQNRFFQELRLRQRLRGWEGVILSISAGSMNAASLVYASPELEGETLDPDYQLFLKGLALTTVNILPHFQTLRDTVLDGRLLVNDIVASHSHQLPVYCLNDGAFFLIRDGRTELRGEAYRMRNGKLIAICADGERKLLCRDGRLRLL